MYRQSGMVRGNSLSVTCRRWPVPGQVPMVSAGLCSGVRVQEGDQPSFPEREELVYQPFPQLVERLELGEECGKDTSPSCLPISPHYVIFPDYHLQTRATSGEPPLPSLQFSQSLGPPIWVHLSPNGASAQTGLFHSPVGACSPDVSTVLIGIGLPFTNCVSRLWDFLFQRLISPPHRSGTQRRILSTRQSASPLWAEPPPAHWSTSYSPSWVSHILLSPTNYSTYSIASPFLILSCFC
ncbi:hypothetical protein E1301_Tti006499 [Triplophysa tibetana]|uniref:Uncharacterized protein n=1 Tax=Triplophysa tibetana TaxID=1572043 RepID=A0A5A9P0M3_9TELE|nr:hypothetical protein E1301_Tti006499 [Triplophysa tibetana]